MQALAIHKRQLERYFNSCHLKHLFTDNNTNFEKLNYVNISDICAEAFVFEFKYAVVCYLATRLKLVWTYLAVNALTCNCLLKDRVTKLSTQQLQYNNNCKTRISNLKVTIN